MERVSAEPVGRSRKPVGNPRPRAVSFGMVQGWELTPRSCVRLCAVRRLQAGRGPCAVERAFHRAENPGTCRGPSAARAKGLFYILNPPWSALARNQWGREAASR